MNAAGKFLTVFKRRRLNFDFLSAAGNIFTKGGQEGRLGSKGGHLHPPKEEGALERRTNLPKGGRLATLNLIRSRISIFTVGNMKIKIH